MTLESRVAQVQHASIVDLTSDDLLPTKSLSLYNEKATGMHREKQRLVGGDK